MKKFIPLLITTLLSLSYFSCSKDVSAVINKPPEVNAGIDQIVYLPKDSIVLNGSASGAGGLQLLYSWSKTSGPSCTIVDPFKASTVVRNLVIGTYIFRLMVTDDYGAYTTDEMNVTVYGETNVNQKPVAHAGEDKTIYTPLSAATLDGSGSFDPDGTIHSYNWSKISGPYSFNIVNQFAAVTEVRALVEGEYSFELTVTDNLSLMSKDTVNISVKSGTVPTCDVSSRPTITPQLIEIGTLSNARIPFVGTAGSKIVFAGGAMINSSGYYDVTDAVDIYDFNTTSWSTAKLSLARDGIATASVGNKIYFIGGGFFELTAHNIMDVYDATTNSWEVILMPTSHSNASATVVGNKIIIAGGYTPSGMLNDQISIYNVTTKQWSAATISKARTGIAAVTVGDKAYFGGGVSNSGLESIVDIYNSTTNTWSTSSLLQLSGSIGGAADGNNIYWQGIQQGYVGKAEIWNTSTGSKKAECISQASSSPTTLVNNHNVLFFTTNNWNNEGFYLSNKFDLYNSITDQWYVGNFPNPFVGAALISANNDIYLAGGKISDNVLSKKVFRISW